MYVVLARQKDKALGSITEVVQTIKHPRSHMKSLSHETTAKNENDKLNLDYMLPGPAELDNTGAPGRKTSQLDSRNDLPSKSTSRYTSSRSSKSGRNSLTRSVLLAFRFSLLQCKQYCSI